ncbi:MAG: hypothetical protein II293_03175, partial [Bacteroidaceae bacterium]|nr:hypothetical protein [Bacteroidaceae bacterium]
RLALCLYHFSRIGDNYFQFAVGLDLERIETKLRFSQSTSFITTIVNNATNLKAICRIICIYPVIPS